MNSITVLRAQLAPEAPTPEFGGRVGLGRDWEEVRAHAGWNARPEEGELFDEVTIFDLPSSSDTDSADAAREICRFHVEEDHALPDRVKAALRSLLDQQKYASAVEYCFDMIWDRGFEDP
jgi:hypothetical protein